MLASSHRRVMPRAWRPNALSVRGAAAVVTALCCAAFFAGALSCTVPNPRFCDVDTGCDDPARPFCDLTGEYAGSSFTPNTCIARPACVLGSADCVDPLAPACVAGVCVACDAPAHCPDDRPSCDTTTHTCEASCAGAPCDSRPGAPFCLAGACVACLEPSHCGPDAPSCEANACAGCDGNGDCVLHTTRPFCESGSGACHECLEDAHCTAAAPVCDGGGCRNCRKNSECPSEICDLDRGACVAEATVIYVDQARGGAAGSCTRLQPCIQLSTGVTQLSATRVWLRLRAGEYTTTGLTLGASAVHVVGDGVNSTGIRATVTTTPVVSVNAAGPVVLEGLVLRGGADGIACAGAGTRPHVTFRRANAVDNVRHGVHASQCTVLLDRAVVSANGEGGLHFTESDFVVENSAVVLNGNSMVGSGGIYLSDSAATTTGVIRFSTITSNFSIAALAGGVTCSPLVRAALTLTSSIVWGNSTPQTTGSLCAWRYSDVGPDSAQPIAEGNLNADPQFVDPGIFDLHLAPTSPCRDAAEDDTGVLSDFDGDSRPASGADIGLDELR